VDRRTSAILAAVRSEPARFTGTAVILSAYLAGGFGASCIGRPLQEGDGPTDVSVQAPPDGRCGLSPKLLVAASTYPRPVGIEVGAVGVWRLVPTGGDLLYETTAIADDRAGTFLAGALMSVPLAGGAPRTITSGYVYFGLIVTDTTLYVERENAYPNMDMDDVVSIPRNGGTPTTFFTFADVNDTLIGGLAWDGDFVYVSSTAAVRAIPIAAPANVITVRSPGANGIQVSSGRLVMAIQGGDVESVALPYTGEAPQLLQTGLSVAPQDLVTCGGRVCWADEGTNSIDQVDPSAGPVMPAVKMPPWFGQAASVAFDGTSFYVGSYGDSDGNSRIVRFPAASVGQGATVASPRGGGAFAVDDECLYWTTADGIYSLAKSVPGIVGQ
jgi:hypothetical protein